MVEILVKKENKLLQREELTVRVPHATQATPSRKELTEALVQGIKVPANRLVIERVLTSPGTTESHARVYVYKAADAVPAGQRGVSERRLKGKAAAVGEASGQGSSGKKAAAEGAAQSAPAKK